MSEKYGRLYVVATPIGNLGDISQRAADLLGAVPLIAAEDTRRTARLLQHLGVRVPMLSYHDHSAAPRRAELLDHLRSGKDLALVCDAGTPLISDPGYRLVAEAIALGVEIVAIPGPSAVIAALSIAGLPTDRFVFEGFLSGGERSARLRQLVQEQRTLVLYETVPRLARLLDELRAAAGEDRRAAVVLEMTKVHERVLRGTVAELAAAVSGASGESGASAGGAVGAGKGEAVVLVEASPGPLQALDSDDLLRCLLELCSPSEAARRAAALTGQPKSALYDRAEQLRRSQGAGKS